MRTEILGIPPGLDPGKPYRMEVENFTFAEDGELIVTYRFLGELKPEPEKEPTEFMLVEVDADKTAELSQLLVNRPYVQSVTVHGKGCCCKNCPWNGDHG